MILELDSLNYSNNDFLDLHKYWVWVLPINKILSSAYSSFGIPAVNCARVKYIWLQEFMMDLSCLFLHTAPK